MGSMSARAGRASRGRATSLRIHVRTAIGRPRSGVARSVRLWRASKGFDGCQRRARGARFGCCCRRSAFSLLPYALSFLLHLDDEFWKLPLHLMHNGADLVGQSGQELEHRLADEQLTCEADVRGQAH
jgi:hypothetical protein